MADDLPEAEAAAAAAAPPLKLTRPTSPQKTNSNTHNAVEDSAMAHTGSVKRVRSFDGDDQEATSNSSSSPKRPRLVEEGDAMTTNCKEQNVNNKDNEEPSSSDKEVVAKKDHLTSNGSLDGNKDRESPIDCSKENSEASIDGASDADVSSQAESECVDKDEDNQNGKAMEVDSTEKGPKNGAPLEPLKEAEQTASLSQSKDQDETCESNEKSTLKESNSDKERTGSTEKSGDKLCDTNAKESDQVVPSADGDEKMEVDGDLDTKQEDKETVKSANGVDTEVTTVESKQNGVEAKSDSASSKDVISKDVASKDVVAKDVVAKDEVAKDEGAKDEVAKEEKAKEEKSKDEVDSKTSEDISQKDVAKPSSQDGKKDADKAGGDDVIVLSDDSCSNAPEPSNQSDSSRPVSPIPEPTDPLGRLSEEQRKSRDDIVKRLNEELRNEEAKLLLLKKLRQSQQQPITVEPKEDSSVDTAKLIGRNPNAVPPPLVHGPGQLKPQLSNQASQLGQQQRMQMPTLIRGADGNVQQVQILQRNMQSGPPPLVLARGGMSNMSNLQQQQQQQMNRNQMIRMISTSHITQTSNSLTTAQHARVSSSNSANETQSAASRQAAAKLALRKQLEKTLLQIPPPKPPPPELHFLPSAANNEFIILVGLEEVVNTILDLEQKDKSKKDPKYIAPFRCAQCKTDFTTIWKQGSKQGIMCENCIVSNQKKALKAEHTNRLKTAFVKALQQEQEIEQRMQQSHSAAQAAASSLNIPKVNKVPIAHSHQSLQASHHGLQVIQQPRQRVLNPAPQQRTMQPVTYAYIPQVAGVNIAGIQMIPKPQFVVSGHHGIVTASDRQREYLLDMITSKSMTGSTISWKR